MTTTTTLENYHRFGAMTVKTHPRQSFFLTIFFYSFIHYIYFFLSLSYFPMSLIKTLTKSEKIYFLHFSLSRFDSIHVSLLDSELPSVVSTFNFANFFDYKLPGIG